MGQNNTSPVPQVFPVHPDLQAQLNPAVTSVQTPWFSHGELEQYDIVCEQSVPEYPASHLQTLPPPTSSIHTPLPEHVNAPHSAISTKT